MKYDPDKHHRQSMRLKHYDYSQSGFYFVTIVTQNRQHVFGRIQNGIMILHDAGQMVESVWRDLPERFPHITLDAFVVMPNHVHGIIGIQTTKDSVPVGAGLVPAPTPATNQPQLHNITQTNNETAFISNDVIRASTRDAPTQTNMPTPSSSNDPASTNQHPTLGDVVGAFKSLTTHAYIMSVRNHSWTPFEKRLWQRNYHESIIRDDDALNKICAYIQNNPKQWMGDAENV